MKLRNYFFTCGALLICALFSEKTHPNQTILTGLVTDSKEGLIGATVKVLKDGNFIKGTITDYNGNYRIELNPGTYDLECNYTGFKPMMIKGVRVKSNKLNTLNFTLSTSTALEEVTIMAYKVPMIEQDKTSSGQTLSSDQIKKLSTRNTNNKVATAAGSTSNNGGNVNIKGARANSTDYYVDGIRIQGNVPPVGSQPAPTVVSGKEIKPKEPRKDYERVDYEDFHDTLDDISREQYNRILENPFQDAKSNGISTFSIDVDAASYANIRRFLNAGQLPPRDAVRLEEMINYFDYQYNGPGSGRHPFEVNTEVAPCPWNPKNRLLTIGLQGEKIDLGQLPASNLVFLIDVSGSMSSENKLPLVKQSLSMLTDQLRPNDRVAIVVYAGAAGLVLESTPGSDKLKIKAALEALASGGSTAGGAGIKLAYDTARKNLIANGNNRVILCSDGDFNVGVSSEDELIKLIENERKSGVYLTVLGYGMGNYQDGKMQSLADRGNGNHAYIDQLSEAKKVLMQECGIL